MLVQRLRRWPNINTALDKLLVFAGQFIHPNHGGNLAGSEIFPVGGVADFLPPDKSSAPCH